jgi:hypothetical protein
LSRFALWPSAFLFAAYRAGPFISHSQNKAFGTINQQEQRANSFVIGMGNSELCEETFDE